MTLSLLIDTSTEKALFALMENGSLKATYHLQGDASLSSTIELSLLDFIKQQGLDRVFSWLERIYIGLGPGSFTGTRVGMILGKTLSFARNIPAVGFSSLELAMQDPKDIPLLDAKSSGIYALEKGVVTLYTPENFSQLDKKKRFVSLNAAPLKARLAGVEIQENPAHPLSALQNSKLSKEPYSFAKTALLAPIYLDALK